MQDASPTLMAPPAELAVLSEPQTRSKRINALVGVAFLALCLKVTIAYTTLGTNDSVTFYTFARSLSEHGLKWTYERGVAWLPKGPIFNHPPMTAWFLRFIYHLSHQAFFQTNGLSFPFLLRLPGILSDFIVVLALLRLSRRDERLHNQQWAVALLAVSPVSLMVSGFHGNTDPVMVLFMVLAGLSCIDGKPWLCGLLFALSCQVKVIPLLFFPIFFCFWLHRRRLVEFILPLICASLVLWWEPLTSFPALFIKNVISYGSYWGLWGITYGLKSTGLAAFNSLLINFSPSQIAIATVLKLLIVGGIVMIAWRRRSMDGWGLMESIALGWILFFVFSPGVCAQYLVWPAPFLLFLSPTFYAAITAASSVFLFSFYNAISHGLPWYLGISTNQLVSRWAPWGLLPWAVFIAGGFLMWKKSRASAPGLAEPDN
jgi:hypothetical protein